LRDFADKLEFSPSRLAEIEDRLAELSRLKRKYGGTIDSALEHLARSQDRLLQIETSDERQKQLEADLQAANSSYMEVAGRLRKERLRAAKKFEQAVEKGIAEVAMENARFQDKIPRVFVVFGEYEQRHNRADQAPALPRLHPLRPLPLFVSDLSSPGKRDGFAARPDLPDEGVRRGARKDNGHVCGTYVPMSGLPRV